jgi:predicted AAA+ superfamily ATPase
MEITGFYSRHLAPCVGRALTDTPVVLINGPRQCGKTTLAQHYLPDLPYYSLDDETILSSIKLDPLGFVRRLDRAIIDEVQHAPELLRSIKLVVDQDRRPGRFLLTGSANLMALPTISDSLAGRMEVLALLPFSQAELDQRGNTFLEHAKEQNWPQPQALHTGDALIERVLQGGYPEMLRREDARRRFAWANSYLKALIDRDLRGIADLEKFEALPRLLAIMGQMAGQLSNFSLIGGQLSLDNKTAQKYVGMLEQVFLLKRVQPWSRNTLSRLIKTPKVHFLDAGLQASLARLTFERALHDKARFGATLETWVFGELSKAISLSEEGWDIYHYRDKEQVEVDFVLENTLQQVIGVEVKASATVNAADFKGLRKLQQHTGQDFITGLVLYDGERAVPFGPDMWAVPLSLL